MGNCLSKCFQLESNEKPILELEYVPIREHKKLGSTREVIIEEVSI
tara:strand:- start:7868 stop:8005 length:138 start_codon:yes stop_codon:yes gene_type:complete